jgi:hypothetical protein
MYCQKEQVFVIKINIAKVEKKEHKNLFLV